MLQERTEPDWIDAFERVLRRRAPQQPGPGIAALRAPELPAILRGKGAIQPRTVCVSNEHPEALVKAHVKRLRSASRMPVLAEGAANLAFKRCVEPAAVPTLENDGVTRIDGRGVDAGPLQESPAPSPGGHPRQRCSLGAG